MAFYTFSPGDLAESAKFNSNWNKIFKLQSEQAISLVSASYKGILSGSSQVMIDKFLDSSGQNNTVDTGAGTTALYRSSNKYYECTLDLSTIILDPSFESVTNWTYSETKSTYTGEQSTSYVTDGTYSYALTATGGDEDQNRYCQILQNVDFTNIKRIKFHIHTESTGQSRAFSYVSVTAGATTIYSKANYYDVPSYTGWVDVDVSAVTGAQDLIFRCGCNACTNIYPNTYLWIDGIRTYPLVDAIVQSVATTIPSGKTKVFVTPLMYEALAAGDSITCDISTDGGSNYLTSQDINKWIDVSSLSNTGSCIVKLNLNTGDGSTTPKILGWRVLAE